MAESKKNKKQNLIKKLINYTELPADAFQAIPKLSLYGSSDLIVENYRGIVEYNEEQIRINTSAGMLKIKGVNLQLVEITQDDLLVEGEITGIEIKK